MSNEQESPKHITKQEAVAFLRGVAKKCSQLTRHSQHGKEKIHYKFFRDNGTSITFTEIINGHERGRVQVAFNVYGEPHIRSSYHITPRPALTQWSDCNT